MAQANPGKDQSRAEARRKPWLKAAVTLILLLLVIVSGSALIYARQQWWEMYMRLIH